MINVDSKLKRISNIFGFQCTCIEEAVSRYQRKSKDGHVP